MLTLNSKTVLVRGKQKTVYEYIVDFRNFAHLLPADQLQDIAVTDETLAFDVAGLGRVGLKIAERHPFSQLVIDAIEGTTADFTFWVNLTEAESNTSHVQITLQANLNMFLEMIARGPLQQFLEMVVEKLEGMEFKP